MQNESKLKSALMLSLKEHLPGFIILRHEDVRTAGIPDFSLTGMGQTSWGEVKYATPNFESSGIQELTMLRLAANGFYARYIIYLEIPERQILIVHPRDIRTLKAEAICEGYNHHWVVEYLRKIHEL